jgi:hypothetical protein
MNFLIFSTKKYSKRISLPTKLLQFKLLNYSANFVDKVQIEIKGGKGGNGCISYEVLSPGRKRPDGGNGGKGGNVYIEGDEEMTGLNFQTFHFNAMDGTHGGSKFFSFLVLIIILNK